MAGGSDISTDLNAFIEGKVLPKPSEKAKDEAKDFKKTEFSDEFLKAVCEQLITLFIERTQTAPTRFNKFKPDVKYLQMFSWKALTKRMKDNFYSSGETKLIKSSVNPNFNVIIFEHDGQVITLDDVIYTQNSKGINGYQILNALAKKSGYGSISVNRQKFNPQKPRNELHYSLIMYLKPAKSTDESTSKDIESTEASGIEEDDI